MLQYRYGVCGDFSELFKLLTNQLGFECSIVGGIYKNNNGIRSEHVWNKLKLGDKYYWMDVDGINWRYYDGQPEKIKPLFFMTESDVVWAKKHGDFIGIDGKLYN